MSELKPIRSYPVPANEAARIDMIAALNLTARKGDPFFHHVTTLAKRIMDTPVAFLSLIGGEDQCFLNMNGTEMTGTPRDMSLCAFTVAKKKTIVIADTHRDPRAVNHPIVVHPPHLRYSASAPVTLTSGFCIGTLCAVDLAPRPMPSADQIAQLEGLAAMVARYYELPHEPDPAHAAQLNRIAQEAQEEFLSLIGHELRTPLNGILGLAQVLEPADPEQAELIEGILASGDHLSRVVDSILAFTDLRSGDITLQETRVDLAGVAGSVVAAFGKLAQISGKSLILDDVPEGPWITGDLAKLELALGCLVANFISHGGSEGLITLRRDDGRALTVEVADNGAGIAPHRQAAIWRAFAVGARPAERHADGIGLGLPLANRVIELHGGELDLITSRQRTCARIRLPAWRSA